MKLLLFSVFLTSYCCLLKAQEQTCAAPQFLKSFNSEKLFLEEETRFQAFIENNKNKTIFRATPIIPVVFHIVYYRPDQDFTDAQVQKQLAILNRDFARLNPDTAKTPSVWKSIASDGGLQFCLAKKDPFGKATTGIIHTRTNVVEFDNVDDMKSSAKGGDDTWNAKHYLNVWVTYIGANTFGYSTFPPDLAAFPLIDGIVVNNKAFATSDSNFVDRNGSRTLTHEVGHWFNLWHIFGNNANATCPTDNVDDTPGQKKPTYTCANFPYYDDCSFAGNGIMFMNYMNYVPDTCYNLFTKGQKDRMLAALQMYRSEILTQTTTCNLVGTTDLNESIDLNVFPNPTHSGSINVEINTRASEMADIFVYDYFGRVIQEKLKISLQNTPISFSNLPIGYYLVRVNTQSETATKTFIVL